jgi:hypothetical protein
MDSYDYGFRAWPVSWSALWVGALAALAIALLIGLLGFAVGAHEVAKAAPVKNVRMVTLVFSIAGAFFAFVVGGWVAARIAGIRRAEPAMLHGSIVWLLTIPMLLVLGGIGGLHYFGGWYAGLVGTPTWAPTAAVAVDPAIAAAARNAAFTTLVTLLLGLVGAVLGGWMASGEPMSLRYYRSRALSPEERPRRVA